MIPKPKGLILASDALFPHFFPEPVLRRLSRRLDWRLCRLREDSAELREEIAQADALLTTWHSPYLTPEMLGSPPRCRIVAHCGGEIRARMDERIVRDLTVTNCPYVMAPPVAEMAMAMVLTLVRGLPEYDAAMKGGLLQDNREAREGEILGGRTVGLVGFGGIGRAFARLIRPFRVRLLVSDPYSDPGRIRRAGGMPCALEDLLSQSSVIVLASALTDETRGMLDARRLALLPGGACVVNVARGGLVVLEDLIPLLAAGRIRAALDVTDPLEPLPSDHELRRLRGVLLTPHVGAGGLEVRRGMGEAAVAEVIRLLSGRAVKNRVTPAMLARMT